MDENRILEQLLILKNQFDSLWQDWSRLGQEREFTDLPHSSSIRELFAEGKSIVGYLAGALRNSDVGTFTLITDYVGRVEKCITPFDVYQRIKEIANQEYQENYRDNWTAGAMLRLYEGQEAQIAQVKKMLDLLRAMPTYQLLVGLPPRASPMDVIFAWSKMWEGDAQLHRGLGENALRSQLTAVLRSAGFVAVSEAHEYQGHADIVVPAASGHYGNQLVIECKIWGGESAFDDAISQLCRYVTSNDSQAALVIFVQQAAFREIVSKACQKLEGHDCFGGWLGGGDTAHGFLLRPAQDNERTVGSTLLMCNLGIARY